MIERGSVSSWPGVPWAMTVPRHVWIMDALPKGPTGKIQKRDIVIPADLTAP